MRSVGNTKRGSNKTQSSSSGSAMTALQIQEYLNLNRPGLLSPSTTISAGASSLVSPSHIRPYTSSQSPNARINNSYAMTNSTRSGVPATAIGDLRMQPPPPLQSTSFSHASSMPFSPMGENTTGSYLPSTTTNTRKHTRNKFQLTPTTGQSLQTSISPASRGGNNIGYPKKHLLPKATPQLHVPLRGDKHGILLHNWPIKEQKLRTGGKRINFNPQPPRNKIIGKIISPTSSNFSQDRVMMFSRGSQRPKKPQTAGQFDRSQKKQQPLSKKIVMQKAKGDRVQFINMSIRQDRQEINEQKKGKINQNGSPSKNIISSQFPNRRILIGSDRINRKLAEENQSVKKQIIRNNNIKQSPNLPKTKKNPKLRPIQPGKQELKGQTNKRSQILAMDPLQIPVVPMNDFEITNNLLETQNIITPLPQDLDDNDINIDEDLKNSCKDKIQQGYVNENQSQNQEILQLD